MPEPEYQPPETMTPEAFAEWMRFAVSPEFLTPERLELLKTMSDHLTRDPALLKLVERMLTDYEEEIRRVSPNDAELVKFGFGWTAESPGGVLVPPAIAAAALAPAAAAIAAMHVPGD